MKKVKNALSDVTVGPRNGAHVCAFVGIYLLGKFSNIIDNEIIGLYRDGGLPVID